MIEEERVQKRARESLAVPFFFFTRFEIVFCRISPNVLWPAEKTITWLADIHHAHTRLLTWNIRWCTAPRALGWQRREGVALAQQNKKKKRNCFSVHFAIPATERRNDMVWDNFCLMLLGALVDAVVVVVVVVVTAVQSSIRAFHSRRPIHDVHKNNICCRK